ncbi:hypothetical protein M9435_004834 [Picochlorum sp. BPE23]|nr:hypothetical protein M9435_004834 [Picochlorum sp. BPE23]
MNLRIRGPNGQSTLRDISKDISTADLLDMIAEATTVPVNCLELRGGYPVKRIDIPEDGSMPATDGLGITPNDVLIVQATPAADSAAPAVSEDKTQSPTAGHVDTTMNEDEMLARAIAASLGEEVPGQQGQPSIPGLIEKGKPAFELLSGSRKAVVRRIVPDDNSCLFSAIAYCVGRGRMGASEMRSLVAQAVVADPIQWNKAILGSDPSEYAAWILDTSKWGGSIELTILSQQLAVEISAFDVQTQRVDTYGEDFGYSKRICVVYDGLHYDALALAAFEGAPEAQDITMFPVKVYRYIKIYTSLQRVSARPRWRKRSSSTCPSYWP